MYNEVYKLYFHVQWIILSLFLLTTKYLISVFMYNEISFLKYLIFIFTYNEESYLYFCLRGSISVLFITTENEVSYVFFHAQWCSVSQFTCSTEYRISISLYNEVSYLYFRLQRNFLSLLPLTTKYHNVCFHVQRSIIMSVSMYNEVS